MPIDGEGWLDFWCILHCLGFRRFPCLSYSTRHDSRSQSNQIFKPFCSSKVSKFGGFNFFQMVLAARRRSMLTWLSRLFVTPMPHLAPPTACTTPARPGRFSVVRHVQHIHFPCRFIHLEFRPIRPAPRATNITQMQSYAFRARVHTSAITASSDSQWTHNVMLIP